MSHGSRGHTHGFNRVTDNVARREAFQRAHPAVVIRHHNQPWRWTAEWTDADGKHERTHGELRGLLDALDREDLD